MDRTQKYDPALGWQGNLENALWENQYRRNEISSEAGARTSADTENREAVEQSITDSYLDHVASEQYMTDLEIRIIELEGRA